MRQLISADLALTNRELDRIVIANENSEPKRKLIYFDDFNKQLQLDWVVKGILAKGHNSHLFGPPGSGKSGMAGSIATHGGAGSTDWHGFKIPEAFASVYFAFERANLVGKRVWAEAQRDGLGRVPVVIRPGIINLMDPKCVDEIAETMLEAEQTLGLPVGLGILDTFNKGIADGGGDEDRAKYQNLAWGHLRRVHERLQYRSHLMGVGHTGKDESRGSRGSNAGTGDNDVEFQIKKDGDIKDVSINKANELPDGPLLRFKMEPYDTGLKDDDGKPVEIWIPGNELVPMSAATDRGPRLTKNQQTMFEILHEAGNTGLSVDAWYELAKGEGIGTKRKQDLGDIRRALKAKSLIIENINGWMVKQP